MAVSKNFTMLPQRKRFDRPLPLEYNNSIGSERIRRPARRHPAALKKRCPRRGHVARAEGEEVCRIARERDMTGFWWALAC